ncbi:MAG: hypothetical protein VKO39_08705 [Cyanobacteriota bacterium]|nr:hypothetical protein [Cyanobacteriota bacterium]
MSRFYIVLVFLSAVASFYVFFKPGILSPVYPEEKMKRSLTTIDSATLISSTKKAVNKDSSDRKLSPVYTYNYSDGSKILAAKVRVRKRDDFKIETYGLLTKNIDPIYLKNSSFVKVVPPSLSGMIGNDKFIQTCVIPKSKQVEDSDFRLDNLLSTVERLNPTADSLFDKFLGTKKNIDYSCLVITYKPASNVKTLPPDNWKQIIRSVQTVLQ